MKIFTTIVIITVSAVVVFGFIFGGSPGEARLARFDEIRIRNLQEMQFQVIEYWRLNNELPESVQEIKPFISESALVDPQTNEPYTYEKTEELTFQLCANFGLKQDLDDEFNRPFVPRIAPLPGIDKTAPIQYRIVPDTWSHPAGEHCFEWEIEVIET